MRILIIEDEPELARHISRALVRHGHIAETRHDGAEGLRAALDDTPDLIVLDLNLNFDPPLDVAPTYRCTPHLQLKLQYSLIHEAGAERDFSHLLALQFTARFCVAHITGNNPVTVSRFSRPAGRTKHGGRPGFTGRAPPRFPRFTP